MKIIPGNTSFYFYYILPIFSLAKYKITFWTASGIDSCEIEKGRNMDSRLFFYA